jgi:acetyltransferase-like isoleucine patch superfamily enzyme
VSLAANLRRLLWLYRYSRRDEWGKVDMYELAAAGKRIRITGMADFGSEPYLVSLGSDVTITSGVSFVTHDGGVGALRERHPGLHVYDTIEVGDRVFIGTRTVILPGVRIGSDVVIGAGSIVTRDIPDGTVAAGNPCRPIRPIAEYEQRALERATWWSGSPSARELKAHVLESVAERREREHAERGR